MKKISEFWENLPKTVKVFVYLIVSTLLAEVLVELGGMEKTFLVRVLAQVINLGIVFLQEAVPEVRRRLNG